MGLNVIKIGWLVAGCVLHITAWASIPDAPINLQVTEETNETVSLSWKDIATNESGFYVMRETPRNDIVEQKIISSNQSEVTLDNFSPNRAYNFYVIAYNNEGNSTKSNVVSARTTHTWDGPLQRCANVTLGQADNTMLTREMLESITVLDCRNANISDISPLPDLVNVEEFDLSHNNISGPLPQWLGNFGNLKQLNLGGNHFTGSIIPEVLHSDMTLLDLGDNNLTGSIPDKIYTLLELRSLGLSINQLTGPLSEQIGNLSHLESLTLGSNPIGGMIPESIGDTNLSSLYLNNASIEGPIPHSLCRLTHLERVYLYGNRLTGTLPSCFGYLGALRSLFLFGNELYGSIPSTWGQMHSLEALSLHGNYLTGKIPTELQSTPLPANGTSLSLANNCSLYTYDNDLIAFIEVRQPGGYEVGILGTNGHCTAIPIMPAVNSFLLD